jgi:opacity protein-like surface antigen
VIAAAPIGLTRESLRPYVTAGLGLLRAKIDYTVSALDVNRTLFAMAAGGGVMGAIGLRTSLRFDLRYFKSISGEPTAGEGFGTARLRFWRAAAGVTFRY